MSIVQRKTPPKHVQWDQQAILRRIGDLEAALAVLTESAGNPLSDTSGIVVRNVRDFEIIAGLDRLSEVMERVQQQLSLLTETELNAGD